MLRPFTPRPADWVQRLHAYVDSRRALPFAWGSNDCATFAAGWVHALTGRDLLGELQIHYTDARGAAVLIGDNGGLLGLATRALGAPLQAPALAQRGDVLLVEIEGRESLTVLTGATVVGPDSAGLAVLPVDWRDVRAAWAV